MRRLISSLLSALPDLANVVVFLLFVFILFGIMGVQSFSGSFYGRCRTQPEPDPISGTWPINENVTRLCSTSGQGEFSCPEGTWCGHPEDFDIPLGKENISDASNINYGITTFDHLGIGMLLIFQAITLEGWVDIMYNLMDSNITIMAAIFFCMLVLFGSFFLLNLILAVIMDAFDKVASKQNLEREAEQKKRELEAQKLQKEQELERANRPPFPEPGEENQRGEEPEEVEKEPDIRDDEADAGLDRRESTGGRGREDDEQIVIGTARQNQSEVCLISGKGHFTGPQIPVSE